MKKLISILVLAVATFTACQKDPISDSSLSEQGSVTMSLNLSVQSMSAGTAEAADQSDTYQITKSAIGTEEPLTTIQNLWVAQFASDGKVVGTPQYFADYPTLTTADDLSVPLIPSGTEEHTIVYIANSFNDALTISLGASFTIDEFKAVTYAISTEQSNFGTDGSKYYAILYGEIKQAIAVEGTLANCELKRNVAKINIKIENNTSSDITFSEAVVQGVPKVSSYFPNIVDGVNFPADGSFTYTSYESEPITDDSETITFYVPVNMRGTSVSTTDEMKNHYATPYCTAVSLLAATSSGESYLYTFYMGANLTDDYNIAPNTEYTYTLTFKTAGDPDTDLRIEDAGGIDYSLPTKARSNCYILNPSGAIDCEYIIPIDRINEFWGNSRYNTAGITGNTLTDVGDNWEAVILWHDYTGTDFSYNSTTDQIGDFKLVEDYDNNTVKVTLPTEFATPANHCNVAFVVRKTKNYYTTTEEQVSYNAGDSKNILWSWHLWITDYNPYIDELTPSMGLYQYTVGGGELHRYNTTLFTTGIYGNKLIMDRNIGARSATAEGYGLANGSYSGAGILHYQFGRHSPYPANQYKYTTDNGYAMTSSTSSTEQYTFAESVQMPYSHLKYNGNWCSETDSEATTYLWNDYQLPSVGYITGKSIFDPSPWGFRVPITGTWANFSSSSAATEATGSQTFKLINVTVADDGTVSSFAPYDRVYNGFAFYPASGSRNNSNASLYAVGSNGYSWSASPSSSTNGYSLYFHSTGVNAAITNTRAYGFPVRPVQE